MDKLINILKIIVRVGIGLFFIVSAILKLLSIENFEIYIYSFNLLSFPLSGLAARCVIACELLAGVLLIIKVKYKWAWWLTLLMLVGFSFLLVYVILFRDDSNCHCMGDLVQMRPSLSLVKNLVTIALLLFVRKEEDYQFYLDLRKYGSSRHAGFGLGFERCVMYLTGMGNIRDVIPFPRTVNNCDL